MKTFVEFPTPLAPDVEKYVDAVARLGDVSAVVLEEDGGVGAIVIAGMIRQRCDKEIFLKIACRDKNRIALRSELVTAAAVGLSNVILVDGTHPSRTQFPAAKPVYELDSLNLLRMIKHDSPGFGDESVPPLGSLSWNIGVCVGGSTAADMARAEKFAAAGADLFFVRSPDAVPRLRDLTAAPIFLSVPQEEVSDIGEVRQRAEAAGADGVNLTSRTPEKVLDGCLASK